MKKKFSNRSYTKFSKNNLNNSNTSKTMQRQISKNWVYLNWFIFGLILFAGLGYATTINEQTINTPQIDLGLIAGLGGVANRPLISNGNVSVTVCSSGCNYTTIQSALNEVPIFLRHKYIVNITQDGTYNEDLWIPASITEDITDRTEGSVEALVIRGNSSNRNGVRVRSIHLSSQVGSQNPTIRDLAIFGSDPYSDENVSIAVYGSNHPILKFINITSTVSDYGILSYGSSITITDINFGDNNLQSATIVKHGGQIWSTDIGSSGSVQGYVHKLIGGFVISKDDNITGALGLYSPSTHTTGFLLKADGTGSTETKALYGVNQLPENLKNLSIVTDADSKIRQVKINSRSATGTDYGFYFDRTGSGRGFLVIGSNTTDTNILMEIQQDGVGGGLFLDQNANGIALDIDSEATTNPPLRIQPSIGTPTCNAGNAGSIYYNLTTNIHYGCNSTTWNPLY